MAGDDHPLCNDVLVAYCAWLGSQPVAAELNKKYTPMRLKITGASRCPPLASVAASFDTDR